MIASPWINFKSVFGGGVNLRKLYLWLSGLNPSNTDAVPPVKVSSIIFTFIS